MQKIYTYRQTMDLVQFKWKVKIGVTLWNQPGFYFPSFQVNLIVLENAISNRQIRELLKCSNHGRILISGGGDIITLSVCSNIFSLMNKGQRSPLLKEFDEIRFYWRVFTFSWCFGQNRKSLGNPVRIDQYLSVDW